MREPWGLRNLRSVPVPSTRESLSMQPSHVQIPLSARPSPPGRSSSTNRMGAGQSLGPSPVTGSRVISARDGLNGEIRGHSKFESLIASAFPDVTTMYDAFQ